jgi:MinD superfamily P-loop ATPase
MRITVVSGKGGVGKSMIASSLAILFSKKKDVIAIDCDVDAANLALWLGIDTAKSDASFEKKISTASKPYIDKDKCTSCGLCVKSCNFQALTKDDSGKAELISYKCEGCGLCEEICPVKAIKLQKVNNCTLSHYKSEFGFPVIQGQIKPGEAESGEVVTKIREYADLLSKDDTYFIQDAAAGIGCPVIASVVGSDYVVAVAEPSKSSFSDVKRALEVVNQFKIPFGIVINKYDLNEKIYSEIKSFAGENYLGSISYDNCIIKSIVELKAVLGNCSNISKQIKEIYENICKRLSK